MTVLTLDSVAYCYVYSLDLPYLIIHAISTKQIHPPTLASPVSVPAYTTATLGHSTTWASLVSVSTYRLPTQTSSTFRLQSYYMPISPPLLLLLLASRESYRVAQSFFCCLLAPPNLLPPPPLLHILSPLHIPLIREVAPPTAPWLPAVALCITSYTSEIGRASCSL